MNINKTKYIFRSLLLQGFWNYRKMQNVGMLYIIYPYLLELYSATPKFLKRSILRNLDTFNTNPVMSLFCLGAVMRQEQVLLKVQNNLNIFYEQEKEWILFRSSIATTVASLGDRLFWSTLKPLSLVLAFTVLYLGQVYFLNDTIDAKNLNLVVVCALVLAFLSYNIPAFVTRYKGLILGYKGSEEDFFGLTKFNWNKSITISKTIGQILTLFVFIYGLYFYFQGAIIDASMITKITLLSAFIILSIFIKKWNIPNIYLYLGSVFIFNLVALF